MFDKFARLLGYAPVSEIRKREKTVTIKESELTEDRCAFEAMKTEYDKQSQWRLVHTETMSVTQTVTDRFTLSRGNLYFQLYESQSGVRKVEYGCTLANVDEEELGDVAKTIEYYHEVVVPWLGGRCVRDIPTWKSAEIVDVISKLSQQ